MDAPGMEKLYVSGGGLEKMKSQLAACKRHSIEVAAAIEHARSFGDISENADYHAAKEEQAMLQARVRHLEDKIAGAVVVDETQIDRDKAYLGATVKVLNKKTNHEATYALVSPVEADSAQGKISVRSPVGRALLGKSVGDTAMAKVPAGNVEFEILEITR